jgi:antitoxin component YwqK of YwqJK toxin-antitoxin module
MRHFLTSFLVIILNTLVFGQNITYDLNLTIKDSLYYFQDKKYSGEVIAIYPNGQAKQKFETINGLATGISYNYFEDLTFDKNKFLDTSVIRSLNQKITKKKKHILDKKKDTLNKQNQINKYIDDDIGGYKKLEKLKEKNAENDLNKRKQKQWDSLTTLNNQKKILIEDLNKLLSQEQNFVDLKKKEESKPVYQNKVDLEFEHRNFVKNGKLKRYYKNGFPKEFSNFKQNKEDGLFELFNDKGVKLEEYQYKKGIKNGKWALFYDNGKIKEEGYFKNNILDSLYKSYGVSGKISSEINYQNGKKNGIFKTYFDGGTIQSEINYVDDKKTGANKIYSKSGILIEDTNYKDDIQDGLSILFHDNGKKRLIKSYQLGKLNGEFISFDGSGDTTLKAIYKNNLLNGPYQEYSGKTNTVSGTYFDGYMNGYWIYKNKMGNTIGEGEFQDPCLWIFSSYADSIFSPEELLRHRREEVDSKGIPIKCRTGKWKLYHDSGVLQQESSYVDGKLEGEFKEWHSNGKLSTEGKYSNGFQNGLWTYYFDDGNLKGKGNFNMGNGTNLGSTGIPKDGRNGKWEMFHSNGKISKEQNWLAGKEEGISKDYTENGFLLSYEIYKNGVRDGLCKYYYENGKLKEEGSCKDGKEEGIYKWYYENGKLKQEGAWNDGKEEGIFKWYYENGKINFEASFSNGKKNGLEKVYYSNGVLEGENNYENGKQISSIKKFNEDGTAFVPVYKNETNQNNKTNVHIPQSKEREKCYKCSGTGRCQTCNGKPFKVRYCNKNKDWEFREEKRPGLRMCSECQGAGAKYKYSSYDGGCIYEKECHYLKCINGWVECTQYRCEHGICKDCEGDGFKD